MKNNFDNLKNLIERLKTITFFQRLFNWKSIRLLLMNALEDLSKLTSNLEQVLDDNSELKQKNTDFIKDLDLKKEQIMSKDLAVQTLEGKIADKDILINQNSASIAASETTISNQDERIQELELTESGLNIKLEEVTKDRDSKLNENTRLTSEEETRKQNYEKNVAALNAIKDGIEKDRRQEIDAMVNAQVEKAHKLRETWSKHQESVKSIIKGICQKHVIEFVEKVPFKGEPDNTLRICGEYIALDAKSPAGEDLSNFPTYIKSEAEKSKKYAKQEGVKRDVFIVVPTNTLECLTQFVYNFADHDVYVISADSIEQTIINLKKIENYEFAEKLSPEERDNICRVIGKFVHLTKRRVQIDAYFMKHFLEMAYQAEADLPTDILEKALEFEKSEKLNPPMEKRTKVINIKDLEKDSKKLNSEVASKGILIDDIKIIEAFNELPLYEKEEDAPAKVDKNYFK
jgi:hypothetical protein